MKLENIFDGDFRDLQVCIAFVIVVGIDKTYDYDIWTWGWGLIAWMWFAKWLVGMLLILFNHDSN